MAFKTEKYNSWQTLHRELKKTLDLFAVSLEEEDNWTPEKSVEFLVLVREIADGIKEYKSRLEQVKNFLSYAVIPRIFDEHGIKSVSYEHLKARVSLKSQLRASVQTDQKENAIQWLKENHPGIVTETINANTLSSFAKLMLEEEGIELPSELFKTETATNASITKIQ